jgi:hypothetical protein
MLGGLRADPSDDRMIRLRARYVHSNLSQAGTASFRRSQHGQSNREADPHQTLELRMPTRHLLLATSRLLIGLSRRFGLLQWQEQH